MTASTGECPARRERIGAIVQNLADAANLEESLEAEELEVIDIDQLLQSYVANCRMTHEDCEFIYRGAGRPVSAKVADYRIEQLLDKIIDNAIDFHRANTPIRVQLDSIRDHCRSPSPIGVRSCRRTRRYRCSIPWSVIADHRISCTSVWVSTWCGSSPSTTAASSGR